MFTAAVVLFTGASLYATDAAPAAPKTEKTQPMCCMFMGQSDLLTKEQKEKATALHAECAKEKCSPEAQAKFFKDVKAMLTPEQIATCKANCEKRGIVGCPICSDAKHKT
jgi:hypothetical protein